MRIVIACMALFPHRITGDKNFYLECLRRVSNCQVRVVSFTGRSGKATQIADGVSIEELARPLHRREFERYGGELGGLRYFRHQHTFGRELIERSICLAGLARWLRAQRIKPGVLHFLDNFGPLMTPFGRSTGAKLVTISSRPVGWPYSPIARAYVRSSTGLIHKIGASSFAWMHALSDLGVPQRRLTRQRWGVPLPNGGSTVERVHKRILWTGYLPNSGHAEFVESLRAAESVVAREPFASFRFVFKPELWNDKLAAYSRPGIDVTVSHQPFEMELRQADALLSPLTPDAILMPPLSWLEAMAVETPVITSQIGGVDELIEDSWSGFTARPGEALSETVLRALGADLRRTGRNARQKIDAEFRIEQAADDLVSLWSAG
jgi:hypothetical protein